MGGSTLRGVGSPTFFIFKSYLKLKTDREVQGCPPYAEENVNGYTWNGGKVTLGMTNEQVFAALGPPTRVRQFDWDTVSQIIAPHYAANHK